jgi:hypothetical protein
LGLSVFGLGCRAWAAAALLGAAALLAGCGGGGGGSPPPSNSAGTDTGSGPITTPPATGTPSTPAFSALTASPAPGAVGVQPQALPRMSFSETLSAASVSTQSFSLRSATGAVAGTVQVQGDAATFVPSTPLVKGTRYTLLASADIASSSGKSLSTAVSLSFTVQDAQWQGAWLLESNNSSYADTPEIAFDPQGNAVAVWVQDAGGVSGIENIWASRYSATTGLWTAPQLIETDDSGAALHPKAAMDSAGNAVVVWHQSDGNRNAVWSNRYLAGSSSWSGATLLGSDSQGQAEFAQLAIDAAGNVLAVWHQYNPLGNSIMARRFDRLLNLWGTPQPIESNQPSAVLSPQLAMNARGDAVVVWQAFSGTRSDIMASRHSASTGSWTSPGLLETNNAGDASEPQAAIDAQGNITAVWYQSDGSVTSIWANRFHAPSLAWSGAFLLESDDSGDAEDVQLAVDVAGNVLVVWDQTINGGTRVWSQRFDAAANSWNAAPTRLSNVLAYTPRIGFDSTGNALIAWEQYDDSAAVYSSRYNATTATWSAPRNLRSDNGFDATNYALALDPLGNAVVVWQQYEGGQQSIWGNVFR